MPRKSKPPTTYHLEVARLQRLIGLVAKDKRITKGDIAEIVHHVNKITGILVATSSVLRPVHRTGTS